MCENIGKAVIDNLLLVILKSKMKDLYNAMEKDTFRNQILGRYIHLLE